MAFSKESADLPIEVRATPGYDISGNVVAVPANFRWVRRVVDSGAGEQFSNLTAEKTVDIFDNVKTVNIPGVGVVSYRKVAIGLSLIASAER